MMPTIPVKWSLIYTYTKPGEPLILPQRFVSGAYYASTHHELPQAEWQWQAIAPSHGLALSEGKQPSAKEIVDRFENSRSASRALLVAPEIYTPAEQIDPSQISYTHNDFPKLRPFDIGFRYEYVDGTITIPETGVGATIYAESAGDDGGFLDPRGFVRHAIWAASAGPLAAAITFERIGNRYDFKASSSLGATYAPSGYSAALVFEQGGQTEEIQGTDVSEFERRAKYEWSRTFAGNGAPIYFHVRDSQGRKTPRTRVYLKEIPRVTWTQDEDDEAIVMADASASFAPASSILKYNWFGPVVEAALDERGQAIPNGVTRNASGSFSTQSPRARLRFHNANGDVKEDGNGDYAHGFVQLWVTGSEAPTAPFPTGANQPYYAFRTLAIPVDAETMDAVTMPDDARITAHPEAGNQGVFIRRIEEGQDESDYLYFFREHSRPRLALHRDGRVALLVRDNKTQNFVRIEAAELMRKWGAPIVIWNNKPRYADILTLRGAIGQHEVEVCVAAVRRANDTEILFKESKDGGKTWPADGQAVKVGTMPRAVPIAIREARVGVLEITDGASVLFRSEKGGAKDSWRPV